MLVMPTAHLFMYVFGFTRMKLALALIHPKYLSALSDVRTLDLRALKHTVSILIRLFPTQPGLLTLSSLYTQFNTLKKKSVRKTLWKKVKLLKMSNFTFFHIFFCEICILKLCNNLISFGVSSVFQFGTVSKWCIRERVKEPEEVFLKSYFE